MKKQLITTIFTLLLSLTLINQSLAWPIPDSGQTKCYDNSFEISCPQPGEPFYGQDGNYLINEPSYTKLDAQGNDLPDDAQEWVMVRDNVTRLIWEVKTANDGYENYSIVNDVDNTYSWYNSNPNTNGGYAGDDNNGKNTESYIHTLNTQRFGGFSDWRLPSMQELRSIVDANSDHSPAINDFFSNTMTSSYWSSTPHSNSDFYVWSVHFNDGFDTVEDKRQSFYVRAVRGLQIHFFDNLVSNNDGTVTDPSKGLMWQQNITTAKSWEQALSYCEHLILGEYTDWRLPEQRTLLSTANFSHYNPALSPHLFAVNMPAFYWSSTSSSRDGSKGINATSGDSNTRYKRSLYYTRAVRGGQSRLVNHIYIGSPMQSSIWTIGYNMPINWETQNISGDVTISLSREGGKNGTFETIIAATDNDGTFDWTVSAPISINCMLKISPVIEPEKATIQGLFTIADTHPPVIHNINDQATFKTEPVNITFTVSDETGGPIFFSANSSNYTFITSRQIQFEPSTIHNLSANTPQIVKATITPGLITGAVTISITAYDSGNLSHTQSFELIIKDAPNIPSSERQFLIDLYNQTSPNVYVSWKKEPRHTDGFSMPGTECSWDGISCYNGGNYITEINLENKSMYGTIPETISNLTHLESLNLSQNQLYSIPESIQSLINLKSLNIANNYMDSSDNLKSITQLTNLTYLDCSHLYLSSVLPADFQNLTNLQYLDISHNDFEGSLFNIISNLTKLQTLIAHHNHFTGQLPDTFNFQQLQLLDISANQFWGQIPSGIQQLSHLTQLILSENNFSKQIPVEIATLTQLEVLKLDRNQLIGEIPYDLINLENLANNESDISYNALYTTNSQLESFLDIKQIGDIWADSQTLPVKDLYIDNITDTSVTLFWAQVSDTFPGGLEISYAKNSESFVAINPLRPKMDQEFTIKGLLPGMQYHFRVRNCTKAHETNNNKIYSDYSTIATINTTGNTPTLDQYIEEGRQYIRNATLDSVIKANTSFENVLAIDPGHEEALLFHALTRFAPLLKIDSSYTSGMPIDNITELLDIYGIDKEGRDLNNWFADLQYDINYNQTIPDGSPSPAEIQTYLQSVWIPEIDAALIDLSSIT